jgi:hypothetical protein
MLVAFYSCSGKSEAAILPAPNAQGKAAIAKRRACWFKNAHSGVVKT